MQMGTNNLPDMSKLPPFGNPAYKSHGNSDYNNLESHQDEPQSNRLPGKRKLAKASKKFPNKYKYVRATPSRTPDSLPDPFRTSVRTESREGHNFVKSGNIFNPFYSEPSKDKDDSSLPDNSETNSPSIPFNIRSKPRSYIPEKDRLPLNPYYNETQDQSELPDAREQFSPEFVYRGRAEHNSRHLQHRGLPDSYDINSPRFSEIQAHLPMGNRELLDSYNRNLPRFPDGDNQSANGRRELPVDIAGNAPRYSSQPPLQRLGPPEGHNTNLPKSQEFDEPVTREPTDRYEHLPDRHKTVFSGRFPNPQPDSDNLKSFQGDRFNQSQVNPKKSFFPRPQSPSKNSNLPERLYEPQVAARPVRVEQISPRLSNSNQSGNREMSSLEMLSAAKSELMLRLLQVENASSEGNDLNAPQISRDPQRFRMASPPQVPPQSSNLMDYQSRTLEHTRQGYEPRYSSSNQQRDFENQPTFRPGYSLPDEGPNSQSSYRAFNLDKDLPRDGLAQKYNPNFTAGNSQRHFPEQFPTPRTISQAQSLYQPSSNSNSLLADESFAQRFHGQAEPRSQPSYSSANYHNDYYSSERPTMPSSNLDFNSGENSYGVQHSQIRNQPRLDFPDPMRRVITHEPGSDI